MVAVSIGAAGTSSMAGSGACGSTPSCRCGPHAPPPRSSLALPPPAHTQAFQALVSSACAAVAAVDQALLRWQAACASLEQVSRRANPHTEAADLWVVGWLVVGGCVLVRLQPDRAHWGNAA